MWLGYGMHHIPFNFYFGNIWYSVIGSPLKILEWIYFLSSFYGVDTDIELPCDVYIFDLLFGDFAICSLNM